MSVAIKFVEIASWVSPAITLAAFSAAIPLIKKFRDAFRDEKTSQTHVEVRKRAA